ncbi:MAG: DUF4868 domain-containing protein [Candidatus Sumerlaeaceae bacterium]|nr:DUF4868 domain-containing protein [Candidatus Sumerlaeaceae bacterium]
MNARRVVDPVAVLSDVFAQNYEDAETQLCLAAILDDAPDIQRVQITDAVAGEFRAISQERLNKLAKTNNASGLVIRPYEPQTLLAQHEIEWLKLSDYPVIRDQIAAVAAPSELDVFAADERIVANLRFYAVALTPPHAGPTVCFRSYSGKKQLGRSRLFAIVARQGTFNKVNESAFLFDSIIDCVAFDGILFIFNKSNFQNIFRFYEQLSKAADDTLRVIKASVPISNFDAFADSCKGHLHKLAKLVNIAKQPYFSRLTMTDIKKTIAKHGLPIQIIGSGKNEKIEFNPSEKWAILKLLDDDYLDSVMTGASYEANSKRENPYAAPAKATGM